MIWWPSLGLTWQTTWMQLRERWTLNGKLWALSLDEIQDNSSKVDAIFLKSMKKGKFIDDIYFSSQFKAQGLINNWMVEGWIS